MYIRRRRGSLGREQEELECSVHPFAAASSSLFSLLVRRAAARRGRREQAAR
eukprot:COSAG02_NODE_9476_length_2205_cov_0.881292_2_plen_52_part_00